MTDVLPENIINMIVQAITDMGSVDATRTFRLLQSSDGIIASYDIRVNQEDLNSVSLISQLNASITSGNFNRDLSANAIAEGATGLLNATTEGIEATIIDTTLRTDRGNDLNSGELAGLIVGLSAFLILCGIVVYLRRGCILKSSIVPDLDQSYPIDPSGGKSRSGKFSSYSASSNRLEQVQNENAADISSDPMESVTEETGYPNVDTTGEVVIQEKNEGNMENI